MDLQFPESNSECPTCGNQSKRVVYGYPTTETLMAAQSGEFILGGCVITRPMKNRFCPVCKVSFSSPVLEPITEEQMRSLFKPEERQD